MGHNRIGRLPRTLRWRQVVQLLGKPTLDASAVARATALAAEMRLRKLSNDPALVHCFWILTSLATAARQPDFVQALAEIGIDTRSDEPILGFIARVSDQVRSEVAAHPESGHVASLASLALRRALSETIGQHGRSLFGSSVDDLQAALRYHAGDVRFGRMAKLFFGDFFAATLSSFVERELSNRTGVSPGLETLRDSQEFAGALDRYARESALIMEEFAGGWYGKNNWESKGADQPRGYGRVCRVRLAKAPHGAHPLRDGMSTRALLLCDGAPAPPGQTDPNLVRERIDWRSPAGNLNFHAQNLGDTTLGDFNGRAADLIQIATCAFAADQEIQRGTDYDVYGEKWRRELHLAVPVRDPEFWSGPDVYGLLLDALGFATDDSWRFTFSQIADRHQKMALMPGDRAVAGQPDYVVLFSGGADSLCAAVELMAGGQGRPLLISHRSTPPTVSRQTTLAAILRQRFPRVAPSHVSFWIHRKGSDRRWPDSTLKPRDQAHQSESRIAYAEHAFTAPIDTTAAYRASLPAEAETP